MEWSLHPLLFKELTTHFGIPSVDLFASRDNNQTPRFYSRFPTPGAETVDALRSPWPPSLLLYAFPPLPLISRVIRKLLEERVELIFLAPHWPPLEPLHEVNLRFLSFKVAFLVTITSARHISEMAALSIRHDLCIFHINRVVLLLDPTFVPKVSSMFHRSQELVLPNFCPSPPHRLERVWHTLDIRRALKIYISHMSS